jgi:outer membrane lipoprotein-sorting protein
MKTDRELEQALENLADLVKPPGSVVEQVMQRLETESLPMDSPPMVRLVPDVPTDGADGVASASHPKSEPPARRRTRRRFAAMLHARTVRWSVPVVVAAGVVLAIGLWPGKPSQGPGSGMAWADIVRQLREARSAHIHIVSTDPQVNGEKDVIQEVYLKAPDKMRGEGKDPSTNLDTILIVNGGQAATLHPAAKRYQTAPSNGFPPSMAQDMLTLFGAPFNRPRTLLPTSGTASGGKIEWRLIPLGTTKRDGRKLEKYRLDQNQNTATRPAEDGNQVFCWLDPTTKQAVLMTQERMVEGATTETSRATIHLNPELSDDLFSTAKPPGYTEAGLTAELGTLLKTYLASREKITHYRLICWSGTRADGLSAAMRGARHGNDLRADEVRPHHFETEADFESAWQKCRVAQRGVSMFVRHGKERRILWAGDGKIADERSYTDPTLMGQMIAGLGWPELPVSLFYAMFSNDATFRRLPPRPDRQGLIGVQFMGDDAGGAECKMHTMHVYWLDPAKDYLCVYYERHQRKGKPWQDRFDWQPDEPVTTEQLEGPFSEHDDWREITEFGRTPQGQWYPKQVRGGGSVLEKGKRKVYGPQVTLIQADFTSPIPDDFFDFPAPSSQPK